MASDFWRVAVVGAIAADLGEVQVAVFNTSYRIMWIVLIMVNALSSAAGIKMSQRLGNMDPSGAKQAGEVGIFLSFVVLAAILSAVFFRIRMFGQIFTQDEEFLDLFETTRVPFCCTLFLMNMSVAIERIPYAMGRTKEVFWMGLIASWGGKHTMYGTCCRVMLLCLSCFVSLTTTIAQVPGVYVLTTYWRNDLFGLYCGMALGYAVLMLLYGYITVTRYVSPTRLCLCMVHLRWKNILIMAISVPFDARPVIGENTPRLPASAQKYLMRSPLLSSKGLTEELCEAQTA